MITIKMDAGDFARLATNSGHWGQMPADWEDRFEPIPGAKFTHRGWVWIHWLGADFTTAILARAFLDAIGEEYEIVWDLAGEEPGQPYGWAILTDYDADR